MNESISYPLTTPYFRLLVPDDAHQCARYFYENAEFHTRYSSVYPEEYFDADHYADILRQYCLIQELGWEFRFGVFINDHSCEELIGVVTLTQVEYGGLLSARLGYTIAHAYRGRGIMHCMVRDVLMFCAMYIKLHRIEATVLPENTASRRILQKNGFQKVGVIPSYMMVQGQWRDMELWSVVLKDMYG